MSNPLMSRLSSNVAATDSSTPRHPDTPPTPLLSSAKPAPWASLFSC